jgi:hypothetical protein
MDEKIVSVASSCCNSRHKSRRAIAALVWASMPSRKPPSGTSVQNDACSMKRFDGIDGLSWCSQMDTKSKASINQHVVLPLYI